MSIAERRPYGAGGLRPRLALKFATFVEST